MCSLHLTNVHHLTFYAVCFNDYLITLSRKTYSIYKKEIFIKRNINKICTILLMLYGSLMITWHTD